MATHTAGSVTVYTRVRTTDEWAASSDLHLDGDRRVRRSAGKPETLALYCSYAPGTPGGQRNDYTKRWCRVAYTPPLCWKCGGDGVFEEGECPLCEGDGEGNETTIWYGVIEDYTDNEQQRRLEYTAVSLEQVLRQLPLAWAYGYDAGAGVKIPMLVFNDYLQVGGHAGKHTEADAPATGKIIFDRSDGNHMREATGADADSAYVFSLAQPWTNQDALEALLCWQCSEWADRTPLKIRLALDQAADDALSNVIARWDFRRKSLGYAIDRLVKSAGPFGWFLQWEDPPETETEWVYLRLVVFSRQPEDIVVRQSSWDLMQTPTSPDCKTSRVRVEVHDRVTTIILRGAPLKVQFSSCYDPHPLRSSVAVDLTRGWELDLETEYLALGGAANEDRSKYDSVYQDYRIGDPGTVGMSAWGVFLTPDMATEDNELGDLIKTGGGYVPNYVAYDRPLLPCNLTLIDYEYSSQAGLFALAADDSNATAPPVHQPVLAWRHHTGGNIVGQRWEARALRDAPGVRIQPLEHGVPRAVLQNNGWRDFVVTASVALDACLEYRADFANVPDDQRQIAVVEMPECEWWAATPGTIIDIEADGTLTTVFGVLRNDLPKLRQRAEEIIRRWSLRDYSACTTSYSNGYYEVTAGRPAAGAARHAEIRRNVVDIRYEPGDFLGQYGGHGINRAIMTVEHVLSRQNWGTNLYSDRPFSRSDTT